MTDAAPAVFCRPSNSLALPRPSANRHGSIPRPNVGHIVSLNAVCPAQVAVMDVRLLGGLGRDRRPHACSGGARRLRCCRTAGYGRHRLRAVLGRGQPPRAQSGVPAQGCGGRRRLDQCGDLRIVGETRRRAPCTRPQRCRHAPKSQACFRLGIWVVVAACGRSIAYF